VHHESKSRGSDYTDERLAEFRAEQALMRERWGELLAEVEEIVRELEAAE
jgi:hypothetical protein